MPWSSGLRSHVAYPWLVPVSHKRSGRSRVGADGRTEIVVVRQGVVTHVPGAAPHPELAAMVASASGVKPSAMRPSYFCINEWRHVLVRKDGLTLLAGRYEAQLIFADRDSEFTAEAPRGLVPGQPWPGSRVGMRYTLTAAGTDVYAKCQDGNGNERKEYLSRFVPDAERWIGEWSRHKPGGGAIYINEARELFCPGGSEDYIYLGYAPLDMWFPSPTSMDIEF